MQVCPGLVKRPLQSTTFKQSNKTLPCPLNHNDTQIIHKYLSWDSNKNK